jgi:hypothetical protein
MMAGLLLFCVQGLAQAALVWRPAPGEPGKGHSRMAPKPFVLSAAADQARLWQPDLAKLDLKAEKGLYRVRPTGMDNYHALVAERRSDEHTLEAAIRFVYLRGRPSGNSPRLLTTAVKTPLDIVPAPLPREHRRYHANHDAVFVLRFKGQPLANAPVTLSTANGSHLQLVSDRSGAVRFTLPDDFPETQPGRENNRPAEFVLQGEVERDGRRYLTSLSAPYHVDPAHWQSFQLGVMVLGVGFVSGLVVNRRKPHDTANGKQGRAG